MAGMTLHVTPEIIERCYDFLRAIPPFKAWRLPPADEVEFGVTLHHDREADHDVAGPVRGRQHSMRVSDYHVNTVDALVQAVAHEMIHAKQMSAHAGKRGHNAEFKRLAAKVATLGGWDWKE